MAAPLGSLTDRYGPRVSVSLPLILLSAEPLQSLSSIWRPCCIGIPLIRSSALGARARNAVHPPLPHRSVLLDRSSNRRLILLMPDVWYVESPRVCSSSLTSSISIFPQLPYTITFRPPLAARSLLSTPLLVLLHPRFSDSRLRTGRAEVPHLPRHPLASDQRLC